MRVIRVPIVLVSILLLVGLLVSPVTAETSVDQSSSSSVDQNANVNGGDMDVHQESSSRTETNDALVEQQAELNATKEAGEEAEVERTIDRNVENPENASITYDSNQTVTEDGDSLTTWQGVRQAIDDTNIGERSEQMETAQVPETMDDAAATEDTATAESVDNQSGIVTYVVETIQNAVDRLLP